MSQNNPLCEWSADKSWPGDETFWYEHEGIIGKNGELQGKKSDSDSK